MKMCIVLFCAVLLVGCGADEVTVCPDDSPPGEDCVKLHQLLSKAGLTTSNTTFKFLPANFKLESDAVISIANVSNISFVASGRAEVTCGKKSGLFFHNVSKLVVKNITFVNCGALWNYRKDSWLGTCGVGLSKCAEVTLDGLEFLSGRNYGVCASNIYGHLTISNSVFGNYTYGCGFYYQQFEPTLDRFSSLHGQPIVTLSNSTFQHTNSPNAVATLVDVTVFSVPLPLKLHIVDVTVTNNTKADYNKGFSFESYSSTSNHVILERYYQTGNIVQGVSGSTTHGGSDIYFSYRGSGSESTTIIEIVDCNFVSNVYVVDDVDPFDIFTFYSVVFFYGGAGAKPLQISVINTTIADNTGKYGVAIYFVSRARGQQTDFQISGSTFANNSQLSADYYKQGTIRVSQVSNLTIHNSLFINNVGAAMVLEYSSVYFSGTNIIRGNKAFNGGGMGLYQDSNMLLSNNATLKIENNVAENLGGGIYVEFVQGTLYYDCSISFNDKSAVIEFNNNSAKAAGNDIYGGNLYTCSIGEQSGWLVLKDYVRASSNYSVEATSDPLRVCDCSEVENCLNITQTLKTLQTYPGKKFNLSLMAVGLVGKGIVLSGVPTAIYASLLPQNATAKPSGIISSSMLVQSSKRSCSNLTYSIQSPNDHEVMLFTVNADGSKIEGYVNALWRDRLRWKDHVDKLMSYSLLMPAYVEVYLLPCPVGFELSPDYSCVCAKALNNSVSGCLIESSQIERKNSYWIGIESSNSTEYSNSSSTSYMIHKHCPFDNCRSGAFLFSLKEPDAQCSHHHSGILCGACEPGYSLILGGTECRQCTNIYLLLLILFTVAGVCLIVFLSLTDATVATGTFSGLLFYANIITDNRTSFFSPQATNSFLSVFIAWLNLDLGIGTCFYDGLDAYVYTWLQLCFPFYIWLLAFLVIITCRHVSFVSKLCGNNIVPVLATLFLLSYTKLLNTITSSLSFTVVEVSDGEQLVVWLRDGNVPYLQGKHIALFLVNLALLFIVLAYTLCIALGPWLQRKTEYRVLFWVVRLKPLFDAYFGPLKDQHRYWTGVLLLSRMILSLVFALNVLGDESINLLAIIFTSSLLLWWSHSVYKNMVLALLNGFFFLNLIVLSSISIYNGSSQYVATSVSTGAAFAVFSGVVFYHCFKRVKKLFALKAGANAIRDDSDDSDNHLLDIATNSRNS
jgi:predicted outer membrane repeat protein